MPTITYRPIATNTLSSSANTVTFSSIPSIYKDLILVSSVNPTSGGNAFKMYFNSDNAGTTYSVTYMSTNGTSSAISGKNQNEPNCRFFDNPNPTANTILITHIMNYSSTSIFKTVLSKNGAAGSSVEANVNLWRSTAAISSLTVFFDTSANAMLSGSIFTLYGIE